MRAEDCIGPAVEALVAEMRQGNVLLLENRFHTGEEPNDPGFAQHLARPADLYGNDASGTVHPAHASTEGITKFISAAVAGLLMQAELNHLGELLATRLYRHLGRGEGVGQDRPDPAPAVQAGSGADRRRDGLCIS
jgi:3-phosphoglycerate kinase